MEIDVENWSRIVEVANYAEAKGISIPEAVERLVNAGLSHEPRIYL